MLESTAPKEEEQMSMAAVAGAGVPARPRPKNGKYWVALMVGGAKGGALRGTFTDKLAANYGILIKHHRDYDDHTRASRIPADVDLVLIIASAISHKTETGTTAFAERANIPYVRVSHKWTFAARSLHACGWLPDQPPVKTKLERPKPSLGAALKLLTPTPMRREAAPELPPPPPPEPPAKVVTEIEEGPVTVQEKPGKLIITLPTSPVAIPDTFIGCIRMLRGFMGKDIASILIGPKDISIEYYAPPAPPAPTEIVTPRPEDMNG